MQMVYSRKKTNREGGEVRICYGISGGRLFKEIAYGICRGYLIKNKVEFPGGPRKNQFFADFLSNFLKY